MQLPLSKPTQFVALEELAEESGRFIRDADDLVRCLTIKFEIELSLGLAVIPIGEMFELAPPQRPLRERRASDGNAHTRRLRCHAALLRDRFGGSDNSARNEALPALVLARKHENCVALGDMLTAIHRLLRHERERLRPRIDVARQRFDGRFTRVLTFAQLLVRERTGSAGETPRCELHSG